MPGVRQKMNSYQTYPQIYAESYLEFIHNRSYPDKARDQRINHKRITTAEIPFWKDIEIGKLQAALLTSNAEIFVNISLAPEGYHDYLAKVVPYADKIVLADPLATIYEWRDRSVVNKQEFRNLFDSILDILLPLYPLIESGILLLLPQPFLWSNSIDNKMWPIEKRLFSKKDFVDSLLTDYEKRLNQNQVLERWLESHENIPAGWKEDPKAYAKVNIMSGALHDLLNGLILASMINGNITSSSINVWNRLMLIHSGVMREWTNKENFISQILPLSKLPYEAKPNWSKLIDFRNESALHISFRKQISNIVSDIKAYAPNFNNMEEAATLLSKEIDRQISSLKSKRESLCNKFEPALAKTVIAGISALLGSKPLALALAGLALFEACKTIRNFRIEKLELKQNPLFAVFCKSAEE